MGSRVEKFQNSLLKFINIEEKKTPDNQIRLIRKSNPSALPQLQMSRVTIGSDQELDSTYIYQQFGKRRMSLHQPACFFKCPPTGDSEMKRRIKTKFLLKNVNRLQKLMKPKQ